jgi:hypothetical protein
MTAIGLRSTVRLDRVVLGLGHQRHGTSERCICTRFLSMHLVGQLSNPSPRLLRILRLSKDHVKPGIAEPRTSPGPVGRRLGNGVIQRAVVEVLARAERPMRTAEIQADVERLLGHAVAKESVSWTLRHGKTPRFECVAYGTYRLR